MFIKKGTDLLVKHRRYGIFIGISSKDFDTDLDIFYPIKTINGFDISCRCSLCEVAIYSESIDKKC